MQYCTEHYSKFLSVLTFGMTPEFWHHLKVILENSSLKSPLNFWNYILLSRNQDSKGVDWPKNLHFWRAWSPRYLASVGMLLGTTISCMHDTTPKSFQEPVICLFITQKQTAVFSALGFAHEKLNFSSVLRTDSHIILWNLELTDP